MNVRSFLSFLAAFSLFASNPARAEGFAGLGDSAEGFASVTKRPLVFPQDFGPHSNFRIEWWYLTANLEGADGAAYGVQWTLFRQAREPGPERDGWANQNLWMGHAAVTSASEHLFAETRGRGGVGQAGVRAEPFAAWIDDWSLAAPEARTGAGLSRLRAEAAGANFRYELELAADGPIVAHGEDGFSRKSERGQASYYFSQPFFKVSGVIAIGGRDVKVSGRAWMDHEWSSQPLASDQKGWDWFSLHLSSGEKLMLFRLRGDATREFRAGTWIGGNGTAQALSGDDIAIEQLSSSSIAGRTMPKKWRLRVKSRDLDIETSPLNANSFMSTSFQYWEGPIVFAGTHEGRGYLEMTGY